MEPAQTLKLRENASIEPRWTSTMSGLECRYLLRDGTTEWYLWLTESEAVIAMAMRYIKNCTEDRIQRYASARHNMQLEPKVIAETIASFEQYGFLEKNRTKEEIEAVQKQGRLDTYTRVQVDAFRSIVNWMCSESPYYSEQIKDYCAGEIPEISSMEDVQKLPRLPKAKFRAEMARLHPTALGENRDAFPTSWATSSGTSGNRVQTLTDPQRQKRFVSDCTWQFIADTIPTSTMTKSVVLTTPVCSGTECHMDINRPIEERIISDGRRLILNSFISPSVATKGTLDAIVSDIIEFRPNVLRGAASYLAALAHHMVRNDITFPEVEYVVLGWELNSRIHIRLLEKVFGCRVIDEWGATEMMPISSQCQAGHYHVADEHYIEIVREGKPVALGEVGQILVTSLRRHATPLLRYEIGDLARAATMERCTCGDPSQIFATVEGRARDVIFNTKGEPVTPREIDNVVSGDEPRDGIHYYSLVQLGQKKYTLRYVASDYGPSLMADALREELLEILGNDADLTFEPIKEIYPSNSGKFRLTYQETPVQDYDW